MLENNLLFRTTNSLGSNVPQQVEVTHHFSAPQMSKIEDFIVSGPSQKVEDPQDMLMNKSMSQFSQNEKEGLRYEINRLRRNWIEELLGGQEEVELIIDFKTYIQKIATILVSELHIPQNQKIFPFQ